MLCNNGQPWTWLCSGFSDAQLAQDEFPRVSQGASSIQSKGDNRQQVQDLLLAVQMEDVMGQVGAETRINHTHGSQVTEPEMGRSKWKNGGGGPEELRPTQRSSRQCPGSMSEVQLLCPTVI